MPKQNQPKEEKREKGTAQAVIREILSWVIPFVIALAVAMFLKNYIIINADVPTGSMENTIMPGDRLIGNIWHTGASRRSAVILSFSVIRTTRKNCM